MASRKNTALSTGLVAAIGIVLLLFLAPAFFVVCRRVAGRLPRPRAFVLVGLALVAVVGGAVLVLGSLDWRIIDFGPYKGLGLYLGLAMGCALVPSAFDRKGLAPALALAGLVGVVWSSSHL